MQVGPCTLKCCSDGSFCNGMGFGHKFLTEDVSPFQDFQCLDQFWGVVTVKDSDLIIMPHEILECKDGVS